MSTPQPASARPPKRARSSSPPATSNSHKVARLSPDSQGSHAAPPAAPQTPLKLDCSNPSPISYQYHASIVDTIVTFAAPQTLLSLRATCHDLRISVERSLFGMTIEGHAVECEGGWRGSFHGLNSRALSLLYSMAKAASLSEPVGVQPACTNTLSMVKITVNGERVRDLLRYFKFRHLEVVVAKISPGVPIIIYIPDVTESVTVHWPIDWTDVSTKHGPYISPWTPPPGFSPDETFAEHVAYMRRLRANSPTLQVVTMILIGPAVDGAPDQLEAIIHRTFGPLMRRSVRFSEMVVVGLDSMFPTANRATLRFIKEMIWEILFHALRRLGEMPRRVDINFLSEAEWHAGMVPVDPRPEPRPPPALETLMSRFSLVD